MRVETIVQTVDQVCRDDLITGYCDPKALIGVNAGRKDAFAQNPFLRDGERDLQLIGHVGREVVGRLNVFPLEIVADGEVLSAYCGDSLYVRDEYRKTLYGVVLLDKLNNVSKDRVSLSAGFSPVAQKLIRMLKNTVYPLHRFMQVRRSRAIFSGCGRMRFLTHFSWLFDAAFALYNWIFRCWIRIALREYELVEIRQDDNAAIARFCELVAKDGHRFRENITPQWVRWVLENDFHKDWLLAKRLYGYRKDGEYVAFVMTRCTQEGNARIGKVIEWQSDGLRTPLERKMILCVMQRELCELDCVYISMGEPDAIGMNWANGFLPGLGCHVISIGMGKGASLRMHDGVDNAANWRLRGGMGDLCFS